MLAIPSRYPGAKAGAGVYQRIINEMPRHDVYVEPFVGSGSILLHKKPARSSIVADADADVAAGWSTIAETGAAGSLTVVCGDARSIIAGYGERITSSWLIYADPPYVMATRRSGAAIYRHEMSDDDHVELLALLRSLPARVMISGYRHPIYDAALSGWRRLDYSVMTRRGPAVESLWLNFPASVERHDLTYLGENFRTRERIKRRKARWCRRVAAMHPLERADLLEALSPWTAMLPAARPSSPEMASGSARQKWRGPPAAAIAGSDAAAGSPSSAMVDVE